MPDEIAAGAAPGAAGGADTGGGGGASSIPPASVSDIDFLNQPDKSAEAAGTQTADASAGSEAKTDDVNLAALEEGQPEWLAKVTDAAARAEVQKLLDGQKAFSERFKDAADLEEFFKDLPGGRDQVAALQTLSKEVGELDSALEANEPEGLATVAERYLSMTPDGGIGLMRAAAQHMAKSSPEAWNQIATELVNSTLKGAGIGADLQGVMSAIAEMRAAAQEQKWEEFGNAAGKLLGQPKAEQKQDPNLQRLTERENAARASEQRALSENWTHKREASASKITAHHRTEVGKVLAKVLPDSVSEKDQKQLITDIQAEIESQVYSNAWLRSQIASLIGERSQDKKGGYSYSNLNADQKAFDQAAELVIKASNSKLITAAVGKVVTKWSKERAASNVAARDKARGTAARTDAGGGRPGANGGRKQITADDLRARNSDGSHKISDRDFLNL